MSGREISGHQTNATLSAPISRKMSRTRLHAATKPAGPSAVAQLDRCGPSRFISHAYRRNTGRPKAPQRLGVRPDVVVLEPVVDRLVGSAAPARRPGTAPVSAMLCSSANGDGTVPSLVEVQHSQAAELGLHRGDLIAGRSAASAASCSGPVGLIHAPRYAPRSGTGGGVRPTGTAGTDAGGGTDVAGGTDGRVAIHLVGSSAFASAGAPGGQRDHADERGQLRACADQWTTASEMTSAIPGEWMRAADRAGSAGTRSRTS